MNKVAIITGGTSGIGFETAKKFLHNDYIVVVASVDNLDLVSKSLIELEFLGEVLYKKCDISVIEDTKDLVTSVMNKYGRIDVLANVAGVVGERVNFIDYPLESISNVININLMGTINISHFVAKEMIKQKNGVIINVGSICSNMANSENIAYHASKGGVEMLTKAMARELSEDGIRVVSVAPGWVKTGMIDQEIENIGSKLHMKNRIIEPIEIANIIYLVSSKEASAINGTTVYADDGYTAFKGIR